MGLDIYHEKATFSIPKIISGVNSYNSHIILKENYEEEGFNVEFPHFEKYVQMVDYAVEIDSVTIVSKSQYLQEVKSWSGGSRSVFLAENMEQKEEILNKYANQKGLELTERIIWQLIEKCEIVDFYELEYRLGFYIEEVGYQRKGVNSQFWERSTSDDIFKFALKEDFEYAFQCVDYYWSSDTKEEVINRKKRFKEDFIDKYEEGASFIYLSY